jgi:hypothetical protein
MPTPFMQPMLYNSIQNHIAPLAVLGLLLIVLPSCAVNHGTIHRAKRNEDYIKETAVMVLDRHADLLEVSRLQDGELKQRLKKFDIEMVEVSRTNHYFYPDSVVVFERAGFPIAAVEIVYDYSSRPRNIATKSNGFIWVKDRIYYRKRTWVIS